MNTGQSSKENPSEELTALYKLKSFCPVRMLNSAPQEVNLELPWTQRDNTRDKRYQQDPYLSDQNETNYQEAYYFLLWDF